MESRDHHGKQAQDQPDQANFGFDVRPAGPYAGQRPDYLPRKGRGGLGRIWVGIVVVAVILGLTWYAFRTEPAPETSQTTLPGSTLETLTPRAPEGLQAESDGEITAFAPVLEALEGVASTEASATSVVSTEPAAMGASTDQEPETPEASAGTDGNRPSAASVVPVAKSAESQSAAAPSSVTESQITTSQTGDRSAAPAPEPVESQSAAVPDQAAAGHSASVVPAADISDFWVVNISSTPDEEESKRLLKRIDGQDLGGQMYFYQTTVNGRLQHRIRVGFFGAKAEAEAAGEKIKTDFNLVATPWAVQPTVNEVEKYKKD